LAATVSAVEGFSDPLQDHRSRPVAEQDGGVAVALVHDRSHDVAAHHRHPLHAGAGDQAGAVGEGEQEAGAGRVHVEPVGLAGADLVLDQGGGAREEHVGGDRGDDDGVQVARLDAPAVQGHLQGLGAQVRGGHARLDPAAGPDTGAGQDPLVAGIHHGRKVIVGDDALRVELAGGCDPHRKGKPLFQRILRKSVALRNP
jgi:hypothetical protein